MRTRCNRPKRSRKIAIPPADTNSTSIKAYVAWTYNPRAPFFPGPPPLEEWCSVGIAPVTSPRGGAQVSTRAEPLRDVTVLLMKRDSLLLSSEICRDSRKPSAVAVLVRHRLPFRQQRLQLGCHLCAVFGCEIPIDSASQAVHESNLRFPI